MKKIFVTFFVFITSMIGWACTALIISGDATADGRPVMLKHQDADKLDKKMAYFQGKKYAFMGVVNADCDSAEVWAGTNEVGFCIMNTAAYNFREDSLPCTMDREGLVMAEVLGECKTLEDFEAYLNSNTKNKKKPLGVEANFGVIDANGGAAFYEVNNTRWVKIDVNKEKDGYKLVTNFCSTGRKEDYKGVERLQTATAIMKENFQKGKTFDHEQILNLISRSYRHELLGVNFTSKNCPKYFVDQDFIPRKSTASCVVFEGVKANDNPHKTVMWTLLGYPACGVAIPMMMVGKQESMPSYMVPDKTGLAPMCSQSLALKNTYVFPLTISNGDRYFDVEALLKGKDKQTALVECAQKAEKKINTTFSYIYDRFYSGELDEKTFVSMYHSQTMTYWELYINAYKDWKVKK